MTRRAARSSMVIVRVRVTAILAVLPEGLCSGPHCAHSNSWNRNDWLARQETQNYRHVSTEGRIFEKS